MKKNLLRTYASMFREGDDSLTYENKKNNIEFMNRTVITVPARIKYISQWPGFSLPEYPHILDKQITGCGFTDWCLSNPFPTILCSPRRILLKNKAEQHPGTVYYAKSESTFEGELRVDADISVKNLKRKKIPEKSTPEYLELVKQQAIEFGEKLGNYVSSCFMTGIVPKILVTYDSFRRVKEYLESAGVLDRFQVIIDEFQSIFIDARFKSETELEFVDHLAGISKVCYLSATPMLEKYLDELQEFCDLPYYELDWTALDPLRIEHPMIVPIPYSGSLNSVAAKVIGDYLVADWEKDYTKDPTTGATIEVESKEVVVYVNSVKNICEIIKKNKLTLDNTNVICADTEENRKAVFAAFGMRASKRSPYPEGFLSTIPKEGEPHKMFTFCTRTTYLGSDFYSTCARTVVISDTNVECLSVDISLDLPQILGRQRLQTNPWKNYAEFYFRDKFGGSGWLTKEEFDGIVQDKLKMSEKYLGMYRGYFDSRDEAFSVQCTKDMETIQRANYYKDHYVAVNHHAGTIPVMALNKLVMVAEQRAFDIQQIDYYSRFNVLSRLGELYSADELGPGESETIDLFIKNFNSLSVFQDRMKYLCMTLSDTTKSDLFRTRILQMVPKEFKNYYVILGPDQIKSLSFQKSKLAEYIGGVAHISRSSDLLGMAIYSRFSEGQRVQKSQAKETLAKIYTELGIPKTPKALDLEIYFETGRAQITDKTTGKKNEGYLLGARKQ